MLKEQTVDKLMDFFAIKSPKERFEYGINEAVKLDPREEGQEEIINALAVAAAITVPKRAVLSALIDQAISARFNADGMSKDEREKIATVLISIFVLDDDNFRAMTNHYKPEIVHVHDVYEMYKSVESVVDGE